MKVICSKDNLKKALSHAIKIISSATSLPILNNILLKTEAGRLQISSTNLETAIKIFVGAQTIEGGQITVPAKTLADYINAIDEEKINLFSEENNNLIIKTAKNESLLKGLSADEFPLIPEVKSETNFFISAPALADALEKVVFAAAYSETQPELSGALMVFEDAQIKVVATDRYRLAEKIIKTQEKFENPLKIILPIRAAAELIRVLNESGEKIELALTENQILFKSDDIEFTSRLIDGQYPDYQQIVPQGYSTKAIIDLKEFVGGLRLAGLFVSENNNIEINVEKTDGNIVLKSTSQKHGSTVSKIKAEVEGEDNSIVFNYRYILDCLDRLTEKKVVMKIINSASPATFMPEKEGDYLYLVMPIKI